MDKLKQWIALTAVGCLAILAAGWFLVVSPKRSEAAELRAAAAEQVSANQVLETQLVQLKAKAKDLPKEQAKLAAVAAKIPTNPALPALIRNLTKAGQEAGVELLSIAPGAPVVDTPAAASAPKAAAPTGDAATSKPAAASAAPPAGLLASIPLTISVNGGYFEVERFVANLERLSRAMRVTNVNVAPGEAPKPTSGGAPAPSQDRSATKKLTGTISSLVFMAVNAVPAPAVNAAAPVAAKK